MTTDQSGCDRGYVQAGLYASNEFDDGDNPHPENQIATIPLVLTVHRLQHPRCPVA